MTAAIIAAVAIHLDASATESAIAEYKKLLAAHDWEFQHSDDPRAYRNGHDELERLHVMRLALDPCYDVWNQIAPASHRRVGR